jgi:signal transduction histidine kinase
VHIDGLSFPEHLHEYLNICHFVSQVAGLSLANARTYQKLTDTLGERDTEISERKRAEGALLLAKNKITLLGSITRHDIQNQLMVILGNIALARVDVTDPAMEEPLREIETATKTIRSLLDFGRVYQEIGSHGSQWQQIAEIISLADIPKGITLETDLRDVSIYADPMLPKVFFNLLDNSVKHGEHVTRIRVSQEQRQNGMIITWEDDGTGIPAGEKERIFERGVGKNTGLGLFVIHEILAITGITIRETGEPGKGARFEILVPAGAYRCDHLPK